MWNQTHVLVIADDTTFAVSLIRRGAPRKDVVNVELPTKRLCLAKSMNALARLPKHNLFEYINYTMPGENHYS